MPNILCIISFISNFHFEWSLYPKKEQLNVQIFLEFFTKKYPESLPNFLKTSTEPLNGPELILTSNLF